MRILNLYAGIGGNRKLWGGDIKVVAVEIDPKIAKVYQDLFPNDEVIVGDAHEYLLKHFREFDFIWSSPPCQTHSDIRRAGVQAGKCKALYPEMSLYQEIIFLKYFAPLKTKWVVENVDPYYDPLIKPFKSGRHLFWSNFPITFKESEQHQIHQDIVGSQEVYGFNIKNTKIDNKRSVLRNLVNPRVALHIFELAFKKPQLTLNQFKEKN
jgi:DNA (cytosine-5)-methyltransferase 1